MGGGGSSYIRGNMGIELSGGAQGFLKEHGDWAVGYRWGGGIKDS